MTNTACEVFEITDSRGDKFLKAYSPAQYDKALIGRMKNLRGAYCRKDERGFVWAIAADHACADEFRAAFDAAAQRISASAGSSINGKNLAHHMYNPNGALYG
ncbi:hypothetical protein [Chelativorans xinjiangense]|uniref:hypothetical protein n=1 Tax=Chelativorans xinjiangense TaxID=2681485 RepID=UPI00135ABE9F|nr:hypothetical protein [Chelativorans xinjiangense]